METSRIIQGDCLEVMKTLPDNSVDAVITDPPYGLSKAPDMKEVLTHWLNGDDYKHRGAGFMGKAWDSFVPGPKIWEEAYRVVRPDGIIASFSGTRTVDLTIMSMKIAAQKYQKNSVSNPNGFKIYQVGDFNFLYGSGFPKSLNIGKSLEKLKKKDPESVSDELIKKFEGYGTALKPAYEPIVIFRKDSDRKLDYPDGVNFYYTSKASKKERNKGCEELYWCDDIQVSKEEYERLEAANEGLKGKERKRLLNGNPHPTVKPISIMEKLIDCAGLKEGIILDPFAGSGTTICAAKKKGFIGIGIEMDEGSIVVANARLNAHD